VIRHRQRHVHKTVLEHVRAALQAGGWFSDPAPFSTDVVTLVDYEPLDIGHVPGYNTVAVSIGEESDDREWELGGGLHRCDYTFFIDIYPASAPVGVAIACDIKDALTESVIRLRDYTNDSDGVDTDGEIEFENVLVEVIATGGTALDKRSWRVVKATAAVYI
jgi:hypothetical protein